MLGHYISKHIPLTSNTQNLSQTCVNVGQHISKDLENLDQLYIGLFNMYKNKTKVFIYKNNGVVTCQKCNGIHVDHKKYYIGKHHFKWKRDIVRFVVYMDIAFSYYFFLTCQLFAFNIFSCFILLLLLFFFFLYLIVKRRRTAALSKF